MRLPPAPVASFASDNVSGAHPAVLDAIAQANRGAAAPYGDDDETRRCEAAFDELFGRPVGTFLTFNGTGANVLALTAMSRAGDAIVCADVAHVFADETGAPEWTAGLKTIGLASADGKLAPAQLAPLARHVGVAHRAQPAILSLSQCTELGAVYTPDEMAELCAAAHALEMRVHVDGSRIANAVASLGDPRAALRAITVDAGVDVVTIGGTKAGALGVEAVVFLDDELGRRGPYARKAVTQLASKMRFLAAQFNALLADDLWLRLADHANAQARRLHDLTFDIEGVAFESPPAANLLFPVLPAAVFEPLRHWSRFGLWDPDRSRARWVTAWDTTDDDVQRFADGVRAAVAQQSIPT